MSRFECEVLIIGGGPVGGTLACALAGAGVEIAVIDREPPLRRIVPDFDGRALAVALATQRVFAGIGLWPSFESYSAPIEHIRIADGASPLFLHYDHRELGGDPFGWIVEARAVRPALAERMDALPSLKLFAPAKIESLERGAHGVEVRFADGTVIAAALAVASDGRFSSTRDDAGIKIVRHDYGQTAIVCTVAHERPHGNTAVEHFLPAGPFAILPLPGHRSSVVWAEKAHLAPTILAQDDSAFTAELRTRFGDALGEIRIEGPRFSYPLTAQLADSYTAPRLALVGDSAHVMHPVAGQGMNMGIRDAAALAESILDARRLGLDIGDLPVLERYARWRRLDNLAMLGMTDGLVRLFSNDFGPLRRARDIGLGAVQHMPRAKRLFTRHAMGLMGDLPRLMKGELL